VRVLLIEDNADIVASIFDFLEARGHVLDNAGDGLSGLNFAVVNDYDVIVLDLGLPGIDGLEVCRQLREVARCVTPILILTARDSLESKLEGFDSGADDYLVKPFACEELEARIKVLYQRTHQARSPRLEVADLVVDEDTHAVERAGQTIELSPTCYRILCYMMCRSHRVVKREEIESAVWGENPPDSDSLRTHLSILRAAIDKPFDKPLVHTVRSFGYRVADLDASQTHP